MLSALDLVRGYSSEILGVGQKDVLIDLLKA